MKKRLINRTEAVAVEPEESEYQEGVLVMYYDEGYRYGHIASVDIDDDGELFCKVQPIYSKHATVKPRQLGYKSKDLEIMKPKEKTDVLAPPAPTAAVDVEPGREPVHSGRDHAGSDHFLRDLYQRITNENVGVVAAPAIRNDHGSGQRRSVCDDEGVDPKTVVHEKKSKGRPRVPKQRSRRKA